jgi:hypothetical protein
VGIHQIGVQGESDRIAFVCNRMFTKASLVPPTVARRLFQQAFGSTVFSDAATAFTDPSGG